MIHIFKKSCVAMLSIMLLIVGILHADTPHKVSLEQSSSLILHYSLKDLGPVDLNTKQLTCRRDSLSLGPRINNDGDIIANRSSGGFFIPANGGEYAPTIKAAKVNFYSINNKKDVLMSINRDSSAVDWVIWSAPQGWNGRRLAIDPVELEGNKIYLSKINDQQKVIGNAKPNNTSMPLEWDPSRGLYRIGVVNNENLYGVVKDINSQNMVVGKSYKQLEHFPFAAFNGQVYSLFKLRRHFRVPSDAKLMFEDIVVSADNQMYGTYWLDRDFDNPMAVKRKKMHTFKWNPIDDSFSHLNYHGMRISAINAHERLVGSRKGQAYFAENNYKPINLISSIDPKESKGWVLLEATDINDAGQIIGYGRKDGKMHLFVASPHVETTAQGLSEELGDAAINQE